MYKLGAALALVFGSFASAQTVTTPAQSAIACAYNTLHPSPNRRDLASQCDSSGKLIVIPGNSCPRTFVGLVGGFNAIISNTPDGAERSLPGFQCHRRDSSRSQYSDHPPSLRASLITSP